MRNDKRGVTITMTVLSYHQVRTFILFPALGSELQKLKCLRPHVWGINNQNCKSLLSQCWDSGKGVLLSWGTAL